MAANTNINDRNGLIYAIYVRSHTPEGTFKAIIPDLERIKALGTDIIWFMPIHPIGVENKKGSLGCPYSISDYRAVNPAYGTMDDFIELTDAIHKLGMRCIIDVVYNHTSYDAVLKREHPEYYFRHENGEFGNKIGAWSDVCDLDYNNKELWQYQIDSLKFWAQYVDGFRCDVASLVPLGFWNEARAAVEEVHPGCFWLAETMRDLEVYRVNLSGVHAWKDFELYEAFDAQYQYDIMSYLDAYWDGTGTMDNYLTHLNQQEYIYPDNYIKMRFLENHDIRRFASVIKDARLRYEWLRFMFFQKGTMQIYAGEEFSNEHLPSLFEREPIDRTGEDISGQIAKLAAAKKQIPADAIFHAWIEDDVVKAEYVLNGKQVACESFEVLK